jgi:hypothetical protein
MAYLPLVIVFVFILAFVAMNPNPHSLKAITKLMASG